MVNDAVDIKILFYSDCRDDNYIGSGIRCKLFDCNVLGLESNEGLAMSDTQKYYDALAHFELHYTCYGHSSKERDDHDRCFALLESLIHRNVYLEKQLEEWKRVAKVKEEQNDELRKTIARLHGDINMLERLNRYHD